MSDLPGVHGCGIAGCVNPSCDYRQEDVDMALAQILDEAEEAKFDRSEIEVIYTNSITLGMVNGFDQVLSKFYREHGYVPKVPQIMLQVNFTEETCWVELSVEREVL